MIDLHPINKESATMQENDETARLQAARQYWDQAAAHFDEAPDHGLLDPAARSAWKSLLAAALPQKRGPVLDIGCGTGSLSVILAELGYDVTGIDISPEMVALARAKAAAQGHAILFHVMDAAFPRLRPGQQFSAILCRHLLWALPEPRSVLQRWADLLEPGGMLLLIEGFWHTGSGLHADEVVGAIPASFSKIAVHPLSDQPALWGGPVTDERFLVVASH
jgi:2-polyprenyl-3-methyl-5-hydroxy-6-metoxy-1,4-benzoquinol methylase